MQANFAHHDNKTRFLLRISTEAALKAVETTSIPVPGNVVGYTTQKIKAAGCPGSIRLCLDAVPPGARDTFAGLLRLQGSGYVPIMATPKEGNPGQDMEAVVFAYSDEGLSYLLPLDEESLKRVLTIGTAVEVAVLRVLLPFQPNCHVDWLAERFEHLSDCFEAHFGPPRANPWESCTFGGTSTKDREALKNMLRCANLQLPQDTSD